MRAEHVGESLEALLDGEPAPGRVSEHLDHCLRCQAELARYRKLRRSLAGLRAAPPLPPVGLLDSLLLVLADAPGRDGREHDARAADEGSDPIEELADAPSAWSSRRLACLVGLAGAAGAVVLVSRGRTRPRLAS